MTKTAATKGDSAQARDDPADLPRTGARRPANESPAQLVDQGVQGPPIVLGDAHQAATVRDGVEVALGFRGGDFALALVDALIDEAASPAEQAHEVLGLKLVGRIRDVRADRTAH